MSNNSEPTEKKQKRDDDNLPENREYDEKGRAVFKKGYSGNPDGRPKGSLNFKTKFYNFLDELAEKENVTPEDLENDLIDTALKKARGGDFRFWKELHDRLYGKPLKRTKMDADVKQETTRELSDEEKELLKKTLKYARKGIDKSGQENTD